MLITCVAIVAAMVGVGEYADNANFIYRYCIFTLYILIIFIPFFGCGICDVQRNIKYTSSYDGGIFSPRFMKKSDFLSALGSWSLIVGWVSPIIDNGLLLLDRALCSVSYEDEVAEELKSTFV